jgi:hypothetical protein
MPGQLTDQANELLTLRRAQSKLQEAQQEFDGEVMRLRAARGDRQQAAQAAQGEQVEQGEPLDISSMFPEQPVNVQRPSSGIPAAALAQAAQALGPAATAQGGRGVQSQAVAGQQLPVAGSVIPEVQTSRSVSSQVVRDQFGGFTTVQTPQSQTDVRLRPNQLDAGDLVSLERIRRADERAGARIAQGEEQLREGVVDDFAEGLGSLIYEIEQARTPEMKRQLGEQLGALYRHIGGRYGQGTADSAIGRAQATAFKIGRETDKERSMEVLKQNRSEDIQGLLGKMRSATASGDKEGENFYRARLLKETTTLGFRFNADGTMEPVAAGGPPKSFSTIARIQSRHNAAQTALTIVDTMIEMVDKDPDLTGVAGSFLRAGSSAKGMVSSVDSLTGGKASEFVKGMKGILYDAAAAGDLPPETLGVLERLENPAIAESEALEVLLPYAMIEVFRTDRPSQETIKAYEQVARITGIGGEKAPGRLRVIKRLLEGTVKFTDGQLAQIGQAPIDAPLGPLTLGEGLPGRATQPTSVDPPSSTGEPRRAGPNEVLVTPLPDGRFKLLMPDGRERVIGGP